MAESKFSYKELEKLISSHNTNKIFDYLKKHNRFDNESLNLLLSKLDIKSLITFTQENYSHPDFPNTWIEPIVNRILDYIKENINNNKNSDYLLEYDLYILISNNLKNFSEDTLLKVVDTIYPNLLLAPLGLVNRLNLEALTELIQRNKIHQIFSILKNKRLRDFRLINNLIEALIETDKIQDLSKEEIAFILKNYFERRTTEKSAIDIERKNILELLKKNKNNIDDNLYKYIVENILIDNINDVYLLEGIENSRAITLLKNAFASLDSRRKIQWLKSIYEVKIPDNLKFTLSMIALKDKDKEVTDLAKQIIKRLKD